MKKTTIIASILVLIIGLGGCGKKEAIAEKTSIDDHQLTKIRKEFSSYRNIQTEAGYQWYDDILEPFNTEIALTGGYVNKQKIKDAVELVDLKKKELDTLNNKDIKQYLDYENELKTKNELSSEQIDDFNKITEKRKKQVDISMKAMNDILDKMKAALEAGNDGRYDPKEAQTIKNLQKDIVHIYDNQIKYEIID